MPRPVNRREFDVFLSHAHDDGAFVAKLHAFLTSAGLTVYWDERSLQPGADFPRAIQSGIERSRSAVLVGTEASIGSGWVGREMGIAIDESTRDSEFRTILIRIGDAPVDDLIRGIAWLSLPQAELDAAAGDAILRAFYPTEGRPNPETSRDVYLSASWRDSDSASARLVARRLRDAGLRLIGDSRDQDGFGEDRIARIIQSCGAFVCIIPSRGSHEASAADGPYRYFMREIDIAAEYALPTIVIADPGVERVDGLQDDWLRMATHAGKLPEDVKARLDGLWDEWLPPERPHHIFVATDLASSTARRDSRERRLLELVTGLPTKVGDEVKDNPVQRGITRLITTARLVIADVSGDDDESFNLDVSIEAGMALASDVNLRLIARGKRRSGPFMLRNVQLSTYADDLGRIALAHAIARRYRRRVVNAEIA